jgi:anti-anti-sigma regulatory factor
MKLRITQRQQGPTTVIQIDGELIAEGGAEFERVCAAALRPLTLDLSGLLMVDEAGRRVVQALIDENVKIEGASPYVELLLKK